MHVCVEPARSPMSQFCYLNKAHQTSIYLGMWDKADRGVLVKQFLQNKLLLQKLLLLARRSLNWSCCRGELISGEERSKDDIREIFNCFRYAHVSSSLCCQCRKRDVAYVTKDGDTSLFTLLFGNFSSLILCNFYLCTSILCQFNLSSTGHIYCFWQQQIYQTCQPWPSTSNIAVLTSGRDNTATICNPSSQTRLSTLNGFQMR